MLWNMDLKGYQTQFMRMSGCPLVLSTLKDHPFRGRVRTLPAFIEPNYSSYPCTPTRTLLGPLSEPSQRLQTSPRGYHSIFPSHPTYEHMTSDVYRERSPMSKYGQLTQRPMFYYPQANVEVESRTQCLDTGGKKTEDVPVILKTPREHYIVPHSIHGEIPLTFPHTETLPDHYLLHGFDNSCYAVSRIPFNASQIRASLKRQHVPPSMASNHADIPPSHQHMEGRQTSSANLHKDQPKPSLLVDPSHQSPPFLHMDKSSSSKHIHQPAVSPASLQMNRIFSPLSSLYIDRSRPSPIGLNIEKLLDCSPCEAKVTHLKETQGLVPEVWLRQSPNHIADSMHRAVTNSANLRKSIYSPVGATGPEHNASSSSFDATVLKGSLKRHIGHSSPSIKVEEDNKNACELGPIRKRQKMELEVVQAEDKTDCPPMPVIDNVFSLAPYKVYLQAPAVLVQAASHVRNVQSPQLLGVKHKPCITEKRPNINEQSVSQMSQKLCPNTSAENPVIQIIEPKSIKVEKVDSPNTDNSVETRNQCEIDQENCIKTTVKKEGKEAGLPDSEPILVIKKCEPDEPEIKLPFAVKTEAVDASKTGETVEKSSESASQGDTCPPQEEMVLSQPKPTIPLQPPDSKPDFTNIPPQCLKLSTYKIVIPDTMHCSSAPTPEKLPVQLMAKFTPKLDLQMPVRKHFLELHHSLCKLVSKSVSVSSEQDLKAWFSQLKTTEPQSPSTKVQKVSCLLGVKAREAWHNEETKSALQKVLERLSEYTAQKRCPFPHVMRTGAVFIPMLVVKELLFPHVQSNFIDQVLQEHKVELRPTTLSEEKILIQLHKRACSSKLRRLMSLKHLPDIYADVVNLFYHTCVCKHLESASPDVQKRVQD
ncbi:hypothetical protein LDENG_00215080 [Lucifuga dentata]|nr:hypothetical protein LDENG_00215080 [Lucifuga dentata]